MFLYRRSVCHEQIAHSRENIYVHGQKPVYLLFQEILFFYEVVWISSFPPNVYF